jgi:hypothetical protein
VLQECRSCSGITVDNPASDAIGFRKSDQQLRSPQYPPRRLSKGLPHSALLAARFDCKHECHGDARFAAHFRRSHRSEVDQRLQPTGTGREMNEVTEETAGKAKEAAAPSGDLAQRYRQIGISAVAAAARYQGAAKNPAYAPAPASWDNRPGEAA